MVYRGTGPPRVRGRGRPFRARGRGWRGPYRGRGGPNRGGHQDEGLRITLRNVGPDPQRDRREGPEYDRRSDTRDHGPGSREDYDYGDESYGQREEGYGEDRPKRESQPGQSPPRKRPHVESDFPPDESLRITVGNDLYEKVEQPPHEAHFQGGDRNEGQSERRDSWQSERRDDRGWEGDRERYDSSRGQNAGPYDARDSGYRGGGRGQPSFPPRGFDSSRGQRGLQWHRGRGDRLGESHRGRGRSDYNYTDRPTQNDRDDQRWPERRRSFSREGRRSRSPGPHRRSRERNSRSHSRGRSGDRRSYSRCRSYSRGRRSYSRSRSGSRGRRSNSRGRSRSRGRSLSRGRRSFSRSRSRGRSYNRIRRSAEKRGSQGRSLSRGRRNLRRSGSRGRSYSRSSSRSPRDEQAYNRAGSNGGPSPADNTMANTTGTEMDRSNEQGGLSKSLGPSVRARSREPGHHSRSRSRDPDSSSSSSSSSSRSSPSDQASQHQEVSEKEYETEMYQRLKSELTANYADPREREERIAKHIREMAKLSPVLFRQFMSKNAGNLSAMTLGPPENEPAQEPDTDQTTGESGDSKPLRSILKRKGDSLSPPRDRNPSPPPEKPMTQIEKVIQSLRKGGKPEPEKVSEKEPSPPPTGALRQLSSYTDDIEDEEEFLYGDALKPKVDKPSTTTSLPFWSANRFQGKKERSLSPPLDANKPSLDIFEDVTANKTAETKIPSALDSFEDKEKSYEQWRATFLQKPKEKEADPLPSSTEETKETSENLSSTVENILKSIGFNFDLSRRMQELARQKKEQEQQSLMINQSASFLSAGGFPGDIKDSVFQRDEPEDMKTPDVASLLDQVRLATKLAQEKARKAKELEERHLHPQQKETSHGRDGKYREEPSKRRESPIRRGSGDRERDKGLYLPPDVSHSPYEPTEPRDLPYPGQYAPQYDEYGYERYNYFPAHSDFPPDFEGHQPKPVRTSNLISLAGDIDLASFDISNKEVGIKRESSPPLKIKGRSGDRRGQEDDMYRRAMEERGRERQVDGSYRRTSGSMEDISPRRVSASGRSEEKGSMEETSYKHSGERILIVKKTEDKSGESPGSDSGFTRRIVLPPKEKSKSLHVRSSETDTRREVIRRSPSPSEPQRNSRRVESHAGSSKVVRRTSSPKASPRHKESPFSARTYKRPASPVTSPKQSKQPRGESPHDYKSKPEPSKSRWEPLKSVPELSKTKQGISADIRKTERKHEPVKIDTDHAKKLAQEKLKLLKQQEERKEKIRVLEERKEKIRILERELFALKQQHNELLRKRRRQKDGHKDPLLGENVKLQDEITAQLKALRDGRDTESGFSVQNKSSGAKTKSGDGLSSRPEEKPAVETAVKKEAPKVRFEYFDPGSHWCQSCNVMCGHMFDFFKHIESKKHQQKLDPFDKPWLMEALQKSEGKMKDGPVQAHPIKGLEFMMATAAFYCPLCKEFCGDLSIAESHMKSDEHTEKYREYITQHPYYEKRYILERSASLSMQRPYSPEPDPDDESSDDDSKSQSSGSKKKSSGHGSSADKKREKEEKKKGMSEEEKSRKKSDKDEKKKCEKDDEKHDKDEKKYDRDQKGRDEKDNDKDMKKSRKKEFKGIPAEGESRMYSDRGEFRRDLDRDDSRQKKDQKVSDHKPSPKHEKDSKSRNCETDSKPPPKEEKSEPEKVEPEVDKAEPALEKSMPQPVSDSIPEDQTAEKTTEKENIDTVAEGKSDVSTTEGKEKEPDADSKSKIAIKLTGKTGIKAAPAASLPPWKVLTRPIPKTSVRSRLLSGRAQATASGLGPGPAPPNEDPVPLDDFLTVGSKQNMPVPVVPDTPKDLPAPKDPKTGKVELEETERQEEMKQMGIEPMSLAPSIQPVAPPPPSQNLSLPPGFQPHPQPSASNESLETSTDSLVPASDSETSCEQQSLKPSTSSDTDSYDSVKERKRGEQSDGDSASDKDDKKPGPNDETDAKLLPVLDAIPLPADIPIPPTPPAKDPPTSTASSATASSKPQPPKDPPPLLTPLSGRKTLLSAPTVPPPGGYGSSNIAQGHNIPQGGYGLSNTSQGGYGPSSMSQGGYGTSQGGYNYPNTSQGGYGPNSQGGYGPPMMGGMGPMYPPQFPFGCGPPMYNMPGPMGPMPGPMGPGPMSGPMGPGPMGPGPMGPGPMGPGPMSGPGPLGPGPMPYQGIGGWGPGPNMPPYNAPVSMSGPSSRPPGRAAVSTSAGPRTGQSTSKPAAATSKPADKTLATKAVDASPAPSTTTASAPSPSGVVSDSVSTLAAPQSSSAGATEQSQAPSTTTSSELPHSFEIDQVNSTSVLESNSVLAPIPSTGTSTSTVFSSQPSPSETVATAALPHSSDTALSVLDCITIANSQDTVTPKVSSQKPAVVDSTPSNTSPTKGRRTRARPQARPLVPVRQTRSRTAKKAATESASPVIDEAASCGEDSNLEEPIPESPDAQSQNSSEAIEATSKMRVGGGKKTGKGKKAVVKKEIADSHEAVPVVVTHSSSSRGCVLDLTNPPVDSSVQLAVSTEVTSSITAAESSASEAQCRTPTEEKSVKSEPAPVAQAGPASEAEDSALNLTVPPQQRRVRRGRVVEQTEPEDLSAWAGPQDLSKSGSSKQKSSTMSAPEMPMDLSVRLFRLPVTQSNVSNASEDMAQFLEMAQSPSSQISSSDAVQHTDSVDSHSVKDTLLSSTSAVNPSTSSQSEEADLAEEAALLADDQPVEGVSGSVQLGVDPDGDPVDFSLAPIDFEQLVGMEDSSAAPTAGNDDNADSTDTGI